MRSFLILNLFLLVISVIVTLSAFINYQAFLSTPIVFKLLILVGMVTPLANIYDVIKHGVILFTLLSGKDLPEE